MFNGEIEKGEEAEAWFSNMKIYFQIYNYSDDLKEKMLIYNLIGKTYILQKDIKKVNAVKERNVTQKAFKNTFKRKYLSE